MIVRLDFGGEAARSRSIRVAPSAAPGVAIVADLNADLPFQDNSADEIFLDHALAHTDDFLGIMEELWRISKPNTIIHARLPHGSSSWSISRDPRHSRAFTLETFNYFDPRFNTSQCTSHATFRLEHARLYLTGARGPARGLALVRAAFSGIIEALVNQDRGMQYRSERWFAPLVGGFEEFYVVLSAVKETSFG
ncbi:MAG: methyltransferase domain-containing protein [Chloroflexi bacterium]|nr:methyltransferase domain-containing protein [Chloroflexota bacterium]